MQILFTIILLLSSIPAGLIIAILCDDELKAGRRNFKIVIISSLSLMFFIILFSRMLTIPLEAELAAVFSLTYLFAISMVSLYFSNRKHNKTFSR